MCTFTVIIYDVQYVIMCTFISFYMMYNTYINFSNNIYSYTFIYTNHNANRCNIYQHTCHVYQCTSLVRQNFQLDIFKLQSQYLLHFTYPRVLWISLPTYEYSRIIVQPSWTDLDVVISSDVAMDVTGVVARIRVEQTSLCHVLWSTRIDHSYRLFGGEHNCRIVKSACQLSLVPDL